MRFSKVVSKKNIFSELDSGDREGALREMVGRLKEHGELTDADVETVLDGLMARERLGTTGIGKGVAIPHVRFDKLDNLLVAVGHSSTGVDFAAVDGDRVKVIFLVLSPESKRDEYLEALRWVSSIGRDEYNNKLLLGAKTPKEFMELFQDIEESS